MDQFLPEQKFSEMVAGALKAHGIEGAIDQLLQKISPGNGSTIIGPGGHPARLNVPSAQDLGLNILQATRILLQTNRIILVALNDLDTRLRLQQAARETSTGSVQRADTPGKPASETIGTRPAETPGANTGD